MFHPLSGTLTYLYSYGRLIFVVLALELLSLDYKASIHDSEGMSTAI